MDVAVQLVARPALAPPVAVPGLRQLEQAWLAVEPELAPEQESRRVLPAFLLPVPAELEQAWELVSE